MASSSVDCEKETARAPSVPCPPPTRTRVPPSPLHSVRRPVAAAGLRQWRGPVPGPAAGAVELRRRAVEDGQQLVRFVRQRLQWTDTEVTIACRIIYMLYRSAVRGRTSIT